uniref:Uncharacterized protein n=1 Tax=Globisporangium ultimum (strain ATCC 200006 / CBS 805.95 / DAOM BR144) TaxID=431595 RepID=K3WYV2_GLOUD
MFNHCVLLIGDAFASVPNSPPFRGIFVIVSWLRSGFWSLLEIGFTIGYNLTELQPIGTNKEILNADVLALLLMDVAILGVFVKERIDPTFTTVVFEIIMQSRLHKYMNVRTMNAYIMAYCIKNYRLGIVPISSLLQKKSPL